MKLNLNYQEMPMLPYSQRSNLPSRPGIYYVGNPDYPVMYIGLTGNLRNRHTGHHRQVQFSEMRGAVIRYRTLPDQILRRITNPKTVLSRLEKQAIDYYQPPLNGTPIPARTIALSCGTGLLMLYR